MTTSSISAAPRALEGRPDRRNLVLAALGLLIAGLVVFGLSTGWTLTVVMSGSMSPAIAAGDALVSRPVSADAVQVGDVVTFADPDRPSRTLTHRVVSIQRDGDTWQVTTRGDANTGEERWNAEADQALTRVEVRVPQLGRVLVPLRSRDGFAGLALLSAGAVLWSIARTRR